MENCVNHPQTKAQSICHGCGKLYCELCLEEGREYYYCKDPKCQKLLNDDKPPELSSAEIICPNCMNIIHPPESERKSRKIHCPECELFIDLTYDPPKILNPKSYTPFLTSLNQGDIALIESILNNSNIDYFITGENFLSVQPFSLPAQFSVLKSQVEEAKELLKDFELHIFGASISKNDKKE